MARAIVRGSARRSLGVLQALGMTAIAAVSLATRAPAQQAVPPSTAESSATSADEAFCKGEALRWYRMAADQGNDEAQDNIGFFYMSGWGSRRIMRKGCVGFARWPIRETRWRSKTSECFTCKVWACRQTAPKQSVGSARLPTRGTKTPKTRCEASTRNDLGSIKWGDT
jgi:TPR repeat protein